MSRADLEEMVIDVGMNADEASAYSRKELVEWLMNHVNLPEENPIQSGKCPAHGNKIEFAHGAKKVFCNPGKHWLNIPRN